MLKVAGSFTTHEGGGCYQRRLTVIEQRFGENVGEKIFAMVQFS